MTQPEAIDVPVGLPGVASLWHGHAVALAGEGVATVVSAVGVWAQPSAVAMSAVLAGASGTSEKMATRATTNATGITVTTEAFQGNEAASAAKTSIDSLLA